MPTQRSPRTLVPALLTLALTACADQSASAVDEAKSLPKDVRPVLTKTAETYKNATSYSDNAVFTRTMTYGDLKIRQKMPFDLTFTKPNKVNAKAYATRVISDGKQQLVLVTVLGQYKTSDAVAKPDHEFLFDAGLNVLDGDPAMLTPLAMLTSSDPLGWLLTDADEFKKLPDEQIDGRPCHTIRFTTSAGKTTLNIDKQTHLILRRQLEAKPEDPGQTAGPVAEVVYKNPKIDPDLSADAFAIPTPKDAEKIQEFPYETQMRKMQDASPLSGKNAPDFTLTNINGQEVKFSSFQGKVVVLDFWATWCGPCLQSMPGMQHLHQKFKTKDVVFLGINTDQGAPKGKVAKTLKDAGVTFTQVLDGKGDVAGKYGVSSLPTVMVVDKAGTIQNVYIGTGPSVKRALARNIRTLLAR